MPLVEAHYHPFLFTTMTLCAMAELGLTAFLISAGNEHKTFPNARYQSLLIFLCFTSSWTTLFAATYMLWFVDRAGHFLANVASSIGWLLITATLWGAGTGLMHTTRMGGNCAGQPTVSRCRQSLTVEALGWAEFALCMLAAVSTCFWMHASNRIASRARSIDSGTRLV